VTSSLFACGEAADHTFRLRVPAQPVDATPFDAGRFESSVASTH
jgi:hypothetical protein